MKLACSCYEVAESSSLLRCTHPEEDYKHYLWQRGLADRDWLSIISRICVIKKNWKMEKKSGTGAGFATFLKWTRSFVPVLLEFIIISGHFYSNRIVLDWDLPKWRKVMVHLPRQAAQLWNLCRAANTTCHTISYSLKGFSAPGWSPFL